MTKINNKFSVSIDAPCKESWAKMQEHKLGKFCNSCQFTVVDFTKMMDKEIVDYLQKNPNRVCGRMASHQMNRNLLPPEIEPTSMWKRAIAFCSFVLRGCLKTQTN